MSCSVVNSCLFFLSFFLLFYSCFVLPRFSLVKYASLRGIKKTTTKQTMFEACLRHILILMQEFTLMKMLF